jgi:hypothetical protein
MIRHHKLHINIRFPRQRKLWAVSNKEWTAQSTALREQLTLCSGSHEIPHLLWKQNVHHSVHNTPPPVPILSEINPNHTPFPGSILILSSYLRLWHNRVSSPKAFQPKFCSHFSSPCALRFRPISYLLISLSVYPTNQTKGEQFARDGLHSTRVCVCVFQRSTSCRATGQTPTSMPASREVSHTCDLTSRKVSCC